MCVSMSDKVYLSIQNFKKKLTIILRGRAGYEVIDNQIISYPASPSRINVLLKTPGSTTLKHRFLPRSILVQNGFCRPFFLRAAKMLSACFIADALLDHICRTDSCVRRANENAGNLISVVQFLINIFVPACTALRLQ